MEPYITSHGNMVYNVEKFEEFLKANLKVDCYTVYHTDYCLDDLAAQYMATGSRSYELHRWETYSGNPEVIYFDINIDLDHTYIITF